MKPNIDNTKFGSITIAGKLYDHDLIIRSNGRIEKRKKKMSKSIYGTSHMISLAEAQYVYEEGAELIIIGAGQNGMVKLSGEADDYFHQQNCAVKILPTSEAIRYWNGAKGAIVGLFHVTC